MTDARKLRLLDVDRLVEECTDQTTRFFNRTDYDAGYCFELFRRAIAGCNSYAWDQIYQIYQPLVASWARHHSGLEACGEEVDYLVNCAFEKMWSAFDAGKFDQFDDLASLLNYLKMCVNSTIVDHVRSNHIKMVEFDTIDNVPPDSPSTDKYVGDQLEKRRFWEMAHKLMHNEKEITVLRDSFVYDLKPSEIYAANSELFDSLEEVYRVKRNLLNRLRRNPMMRQFFDR